MANILTEKNPLKTSARKKITRGKKQLKNIPGPIKSHNRKNDSSRSMRGLAQSVQVDTWAWVRQNIIYNSKYYITCRQVTTVLPSWWILVHLQILSRWSPAGLTSWSLKFAWCGSRSSCRREWLSPEGPGLKTIITGAKTFNRPVWTSTIQLAHLINTFPCSAPAPPLYACATSAIGAYFPSNSLHSNDRKYTSLLYSTVQATLIIQGLPYYRTIGTVSSHIQWLISISRNVN